jgi:hypothetical protein
MSALVYRRGWPETFRRTLVALEPKEPALQLSIIAGDARFLQHESDQAGRKEAHH